MSSTFATTGTNRSPVTVIGLGAMGTALAGAFLENGHPTTVWNRSDGKADGLVAEGAIPAATVAEAAAASPLVVVCVSNYEAVHEILGSLGGALSGRVLVNLTTGTPEQARTTAARAQEHGADYLDGVIHAGPAQVGTPAAMFLHSGAPCAFETHEATLNVLGGSITHVGTDAGLACLYDMALLGLWYETEFAYLHALSLVGAESVGATTFASFATTQLTHVVNSLADTAREVRDGRYPRGPAHLSEHAPVLDQLIHTKQAQGIDTGQLRHIRDLADQRIAGGHDTDGFTSLVEVIKNPST